MDYIIRRSMEDLDSTGYIEVGPGRYTGQHWQPGFVFIWEDAFATAEGIVERHLPEYSHFGMSDVPAEIGRAIIQDWRGAAAQLAAVGPEEAARILNSPAWFRAGLEEEPRSHRGKIAAMLRELADECERFYARGEWFCILGI